MIEEGEPKVEEIVDPPTSSVKILNRQVEESKRVASAGPRITSKDQPTAERKTHGYGTRAATGGNVKWENNG